MAPSRREAHASAGERGVAFVGDVTNSVVNTGDNNTYNLYVGAEAGAALVQAGLLPAASQASPPASSLTASTVSRSP